MTDDVPTYTIRNINECNEFIHFKNTVEIYNILIKNKKDIVDVIKTLYVDELNRYIDIHLYSSCPYMQQVISTIRRKPEIFGKKINDFDISIIDLMATDELLKNENENKTI